MTIKSVTLPVLGLLALLPCTTEAQSLFPMQQTEILGNNPGLQAAAGACESAKADNLSGLTLANPDVSVSYMFGSPSDVPNKTNIAVSQTFDFPTLSGARRRVAEAEGRIQDAAYMASRSAVALEVENALINYIYNYQLVKELEAQDKQMRELQQAASRALESGTMTTLEYNNIKLSVLNLENDLDMARVELTSATRALSVLNGGALPPGLPTSWPEAPLPSSIEEWISQAAAVNPELLSLQGELAKAQEEINLRKKEGLPEFSVGYTNELVKDANYHGAAIGFSLPLWGNKGRVKAAKAAKAAADVNLQAAQDNFRLTVQSDYERARMLLDIRNRYDEAYAEALERTEQYLKVALDKKAIGTIEYMSAHTDLYNYALRRLEAARDFQLARAALYAPTL